MRLRGRWAAMLCLCVSPAAASYLGLRNQGNTCYMNSLLQVLHHLPDFRRAIYGMPTTVNSTRKALDEEMPLALQRVFYELQHGEEHGAGDVGTEVLTDSFGWGEEEVQVQQDVQEFCRMLCEALQGRLREWGRVDAVAELFEGSLSSVTRCTRVNFRSEKEEGFYDLQLMVDGCPSLHASLREFVREEALVGANKFNTRQPQFGRQDARRGTRFKRLPPVLQLHLKRFMYDAETGSMHKLQSEFAFPTTLRMFKYLRHGAPPQPKPVYRLFAVLSHVGGANAGHYVAYVNPLGGKQWYEFNDAQVTPVPEEVAVRQQYGGRFARSKGLFGMGAAPNAYMLVYVRQVTARRPRLPAPALHATGRRQPPTPPRCRSSRRPVPDRPADQPDPPPPPPPPRASLPDGGGGGDGRDGRPAAARREGGLRAGAAQSHRRGAWLGRRCVRGGRLGRRLWPVTQGRTSLDGHVAEVANAMRGAG